MTRHQSFMEVCDRRAIAVDPPNRRTFVETELIQAVDARRLERPQDEQSWVRSTLQHILTVLVGYSARQLRALARCTAVQVFCRRTRPGCRDAKLSMLNIESRKQYPYGPLARLSVWDEILATDECFDLPDENALKQKLGDLFKLVSKRACDRMVARLLPLLDIHDNDREQVAKLVTGSDFQLEVKMVDAHMTVLHHVKTMKRWLRRQWSVTFTDLEMSESTISDLSEPSDLRAQYLDHVARLRPSGDNSSVNFLIDPSLYPLLPLTTVPRLAPSLDSHGWWGPLQRLQNLLVADHVRVVDAPPRWVPADVLVGSDGSVRILSYIRNLHPQHFARLYQTIERLLERFVPLFDRVLTRSENSFPLTKTLDKSHDGVIKSWATLMQRLAVDDDQAASPRVVSLCGRTVQVVVEVAEIIVGNDPPESTASVPEWRHLGPANASILATGMYFAVVENLKTPRISLRRQARGGARELEDCSIPQEYPRSHKNASGHHVAPESCGELPIVQDRCAVAPNYLEMRVDPLTRQDESAPGRLHVLFFHLVSPASVFVESSTLAPPLRSDWVREATISALTRAKRLPAHVQRVIEEMIGPMGMSADDVAKYRERLTSVHLFA